MNKENGVVDKDEKSLDLNDQEDEDFHSYKKPQSDKMYQNIKVENKVLRNFAKTYLLEGIKSVRGIESWLKWWR